jgi:hypothetical protein
MSSTRQYGSDDVVCMDDGLVPNYLDGTVHVRRQAKDCSARGF